MFVICKDSMAMVNLDRCAIVEIEGMSIYASDPLPKRDGEVRSYKLLGSYSSEENAKEAFCDLRKALIAKQDVFDMPAMP